MNPMLRPKCVCLTALGVPCGRPSVQYLMQPICQWHVKEITIGVADHHAEMHFPGHAIYGADDLAEARERHTWVYFLKSESRGLVKIGYSTEPGHRRAQLQYRHGPLELLGIERGGPHRERDLHIAFDEWRIEGEWFQCTSEIETYAARLPFTLDGLHVLTRAKARSVKKVSA